MLYAIFLGENGHDWQVPDAIKDGLVKGEKYEVSWVDMGGCSTSITLMNNDKGYNSVMFEFEEDGIPIDIFRDKRYNPYL
jgi:hypothetical protein